MLVTAADQTGFASEAGTLGVRLTKFRDPLRIPPVLRPGPLQLLTVRRRTEQVRLRTFVVMPEQVMKLDPHQRRLPPHHLA